MLACVRALVALALFALVCPALTIFSTDFETGIPDGLVASHGVYVEISGSGVLWDGTGAPVAANLGNWFLYNEGLGLSSSVLTLTDLPEHTSLTLSFVAVLIGSWDGYTFPTCCTPDLLGVKLDGVLTWSEAYRNYSTLAPDGWGTYLTGEDDWFFDPRYTESAWEVSFTRPHSGPTAVIEFYAFGAGYQGGLDEAFGIDMLRIDIDAVVPEPGTGAMLWAGALAFLAARARRGHR